MPKGRRPNVPESTWEERKESIRKLYLDERKQLVGHDGVIEIMRKRGFEASNWQYQAHLERWNFRKKLTRDMWHAIKHVLDQRRLDGLESIVYAYGSSIDESRVIKETQRYKACRIDEESCRRVPLPTEVEIKSPHELALVATTTIEQIATFGCHIPTFRESSFDHDFGLLQCLPGEIALNDLVFPQIMDNNVPGNQFSEVLETSSQDFQLPQVAWTMPSHGMQAHDQCSNHLSFAEPSFTTATSPLGSRIPQSTASLLQSLMPNLLIRSSRARHSSQSLIRSPTHVAMVRQIMYILMNNFAGSGISGFYGMLEQVKEFSLSQLEDLLEAVPAPFDAALAQGLLTIGIKANVPRIVKLLLDRDVEIHAITCHSRSGPILPLGLACKHLHLNIVRLLLEHKVDVNRRLNDSAPFYSSTAMGDLATALNKLYTRLPLSRGSVTYPAGACEIFRCLLQAGAHLDSVDLCKVHIWFSESLLDIYIKSTRHDTRGLSTLPMPPPPPGANGHLPQMGNRLWLALNTVVFGAETAALLMVKRLHGDNMNDGDSNQQRMDEIGTILHVAASLGSLRIVEYCISRGVKVTSKDWCEAIRAGQLHVLSNFIGKETDIGRIALSPSNPTSRPMIIKEMIEVGGESRSTDLRHDHRSITPCVVRTPFAEAYRCKNKECIRIFQASGLKQVAITTEDFAASFNAFLYVGAQSGDTHLLKFLASVAAITPDFRGCFQGIKSPSGLEAAVIENATSGGHDECVHILLDLGFIPTSQALKIAIIARNELLVQLFLDIGVDAGNPSLLVEAIKWGHRRFIEHMLHAGIFSQAHYSMSYVDFCQTPPRSMTVSDVLSVAMDVGNEELAKTLIDRGIREQLPNHGISTTSLQMAIRRGRDDIALGLLSKGANANDPVALVEAASHSRRVFTALLSAFRMQYPYGDTCFAKQALCNSIKQADLEAIRLLGSFADVNMIYDDLGRLGIHETKSRGRVDYESYTLFGAGIIMGNTHVVKVLIDVGGDAKSFVAIENLFATDLRILAVSQAILGENLEMVRLLCDFGADINFSATMGTKDTALQLAVKVDSYAIAEFLLLAGVDPNARPSVRKGANALQAAAKNGNVGIADLLYRYHVDVNAPGSRILGKTAFEFAAENGRMDMLLWLYHHGLDISLDGGEQIRNAMKYAETAGQPAARDLVVQLAADVGINAVSMKSEWDAALRKKVQEQFEEDWSTWV